MRKKKYLVSPERVEERSRADNEFYEKYNVIIKQAKAPEKRGQRTTDTTHK